MKKSTSHKKAGAGKTSVGKAKSGIKATAQKKPLISKASTNGTARSGGTQKKGQDSLEALKKAFLIGLGATVMSAEKLRDAVKDIVDDMVARGDINPAEAKKAADDLKKRFQDGKFEFEDTVRKAVGLARVKTLETLDKVSHELEGVLSRNAAAKKPAKKTAAKKATAKKTSAKKTTKPAAKKATTKKSTTKATKTKVTKKVTKPTAKKAAAKSTMKKAASKPAAKKTTKTTAAKSTTGKTKTVAVKKSAIKSTVKKAASKPAAKKATAKKATPAAAKKPVGVKAPAAKTGTSA